jgi:hypothetical protein
MVVHTEKTTKPKVNTYEAIFEENSIDLHTDCDSEIILETHSVRKLCFIFSVLHQLEHFKMYLRT